MNHSRQLQNKFDFFVVVVEPFEALESIESSPSTLFIPTATEYFCVDLLQMSRRYFHVNQRPKKHIF